MTTISRAGKQQIECERPTASIAISGTEDQIQNIIKDPTSGLLSRFTFYRFATKAPTFLMPGLRKNQILDSEWTRRQEKCSRILMNMERYPDAVAVLTKEQEMKLQEIGKMGEVYTKVLGTDRAFQIVTRGILQLIRIAAILANMRRYDDVMNDPTCGADSWDVFEIDNDSLDAAIMIFHVFFQCNIKVFAAITDLQPVKGSKGKASGALELFEYLPDTFTTGRKGAGTDLEKACEILDIKFGTARRYLTKWRENAMIAEAGTGKYKKAEKGI